MEKNLKIIVIIGVVIILVFVFLIIDLMMDRNNSQQVTTETVQDTSYSKEDYVINQSVYLYADPYASYNFV